jgi:hypothetical protein
MKNKLYPEETYDHNFWGMWFRKTKEKINRRERDILNPFNGNMMRRKRKSVPGFIYLMECEGCYKVGKSKRVEGRLKHLQDANPFPIKLVAKRRVNDSAYCEKMLHRCLLTRRIENKHSREWYSLWVDKKLPGGDLQYLLEIYEI